VTIPKEEDGPVSDRLDVIIRLLLDRERKDDKKITVGEQLVWLESLGLLSKDAAKILGIDVGQLSSYRRSASKKR